jgi:3-hydroxybutyryl-CoA dehydrogenase
LKNENPLSRVDKVNALSTDQVVAVIGAGTMGAGIAQVAAQAGHPVLLYDAAPGSAQKAIAKTAEGMERLVERGKFSAEDVAATLSRMTPVEGLEDLSPAGLVIEAIIEDLDIKQTLFKNLETICKANTILASNTSSLSITAIGDSLERPENFIGLHFFNPAQVMKLVEVIRGSASASNIVDNAFATAEAWGKKPVHAASTPGFIVNRVARPFYGEALRVLEEGAVDAATFDAIMRESGGFRMGPFELMDLIGNDVNLAVTTSVYNAFGQAPRFAPSSCQQDLVAAGKLGRKSGRGFYDYSEGTAPARPDTYADVPPPESVTIHGDLGVASVLAELIEKAGIRVQHKPSDSGHEYLEVGSAHLYLCDGGLAGNHGDDAVAFDLALDYEKATRIALAPSTTCDPAALASAVGLFQVLGKSVSVISDLAGMVVMRTVCMLANEGADAVDNQVCTEQAVDTAMCYGVNYPAGPLHWARAIGFGVVERVLDNMAAVYEDPRYRCSNWIRNKAVK